MSSVDSMPKGFKCAGVSAGVKPGGAKDMALVVSELLAVPAGVFTSNRVCAAPVKVCREHLGHGLARAIVMNSGVANACTGAEGMVAARRMAAHAAKRLGCAPQEIFVCSTGRIGPQLPMERILPGIDALVSAADGGSVRQAAEAMMTTDTRPKVAARELEVQGRPVKLVGLAKGAGMIEPNMATMLCFIATDAAVERHAWQRALKTAADRSFNRISVDGDQSTNDTVLALANGAAGHPVLGEDGAEWGALAHALEKVCFELAMMIVHDGEGADRFVTVNVSGGVSDAEADRAARAVANSMLNKTAWAGVYPNWGRIMDALGYSGATVVEERTDVAYDAVPAVAGGVRSPAPQEELARVVSQAEFAVNINLNLGGGEATVYTCNCTEAYVRINRD